jgi:hypothetical protein
LWKETGLFKAGPEEDGEHLSFKFPSSRAHRIGRVFMGHRDYSQTVSRKSLG